MGGPYVIKNTTTGKYIDIDSASGGYPYEVDFLYSAHVFHSKEDALKYKKVMKPGESESLKNDNWELHLVIPTTRKVSWE